MTAPLTHGVTPRVPHVFVSGIRAADLPVPVDPLIPTLEADLEPLPPVVRRYLEFMGVAAGRVPTWSFAAHLTGRFRRSEREAWMPADAWQYNSGLEVARLFWMRLTFGGHLPMTGWDTYLHGRGRMHGKLLGLVTVAHGHGGPFDIGELTTYLNDAVLMAPGLLLRLPTTWTGVDDHTFRVGLSDHGRTVSAEVTVNAQGAPMSFTTMDRFMDRPGGPKRTRWTTPVGGWTVVADRPVLTSASAEWTVPGGPLRYAELSLASIRYDVGPAPPWR